MRTTNCIHSAILFVFSSSLNLKAAIWLLQTSAVFLKRHFVGPKKKSILSSALRPCCEQTLLSLHAIRCVSFARVLLLWARNFVKLPSRVFEFCVRVFLFSKRTSILFFKQCLRFCCSHCLSYRPMDTIKQACARTASKITTSTNLYLGSQRNLFQDQP